MHDDPLYRPLKTLLAHRSPPAVVAPPTPEDVAHALAVSEAEVSRILEGRPPPQEVLLRLVEWLVVWRDLHGAQAAKALREEQPWLPRVCPTPLTALRQGRLHLLEAAALALALGEEPP